MGEVTQIEAVAVREYRSGEVVVREGAGNDFFYAILQGEVQIQQMDKAIRIIRDHDVFGLENYFRGRPYTTTAKAMKPSRIATYRCDQLEDMVHSKPGLVFRIVRSAFLQLEQTTSIAQQNIKYSESISLDLREYQDGDVIIREGDHGNEIYKLYSTEGGLEVLKNDVLVGMITEPGEYFGEMSFLLNEPRTATIRSIGKSVIEVIPVHEGDIESLIYNDPEMANKIVTNLAQRLKRTNLKVVR